MDPLGNAYVIISYLVAPLVNDMNLVSFIKYSCPFDVCLKCTC